LGKSIAFFFKEEKVEDEKLGGLSTVPPSPYKKQPLTIIEPTARLIGDE
jgi:hypothetical protein